MANKYESKLEKISRIMFKISQYLSEMFELSLSIDSKKCREQTVKYIKKTQNRAYKMIDKYKLNDNKGGSHQYHLDGSIDIYNPHTDKQNVLDMIDYFYLNRNYENAKEFTKIVSPLLHEHETIHYLSLNDYICNIEPKKFYNADCWQEFLKQGSIDKEIFDVNIPLSQEKINEINNKYSISLIMEKEIDGKSL